MRHGWGKFMVVGGTAIAGAALAQEPPSGIAEPLNDPATWITPNDYPPSALRVEAQGSTGVRLDVGDGGRVRGCTITTSSGNADLDAATCRALFIRAFFTPSSAGKSFSRRIRWSIPSAPPRTTPSSPGGWPAPGVPTDLDTFPAREMVIDTELVLDEQGRVEQCRTGERRPETMPDLCRVALVGSRNGGGFTQRGKPVKVRVHTRNVVTVTPL